MSLCAALAAGEGLAAQVPRYAGMWPLSALLAAMIGLFGYGFALKWWKIFFAFFAGVTLFLSSSVDAEMELRQSPWLRGQLRYKSHRSEVTPAKSSFSRCAGYGLEHDRDVASVNRAILLGERYRLSGSTRRAFVDSGAIHVFAVSGLHVMIVAGVISVALAFFFIPYRWIGLVSIPLMWGYVVLIGSPPSALRAGLMASFYFLSRVLYRRSDSLRAWELSFLIIHVFNPSAIVNVGSLLSFAVMLSLVLANRMLRDEKSLLKKTFFLTLAAWSCGLPIAAHVFGRVTPGGILSNLFLFAVAEYSVAAGMVGMIAGFFSEWVSAHFNNFSALFTEAMVGIAYAVASLPGSNIEVSRWGWLESAQWYLAMLLLWWLLCSVQKRRNLV